MPISKKILLDTNFLLIPAQFGVDIFSEIERICHFPYKLCVLDKTVNELEKIEQTQKGKHRERAKLALSLIKNKKINIIPSEKGNYVDDIIVGLINSNYIVATQDKELKKRVEAKKVPIISLRQKKYLIME